MRKTILFICVHNSARSNKSRDEIRRWIGETLGKP
jgi:protein-tyrosine-phosphatase